MLAVASALAFALRLRLAHHGWQRPAAAACKCVRAVDYCVARSIGLVLLQILEICSVIGVSQRHWPQGLTNKLAFHKRGTRAEKRAPHIVRRRKGGKWITEVEGVDSDAAPVRSASLEGGGLTHGMLVQ